MTDNIKQLIQRAIEEKKISPRKAIAILDKMKINEITDNEQKFAICREYLFNCIQLSDYKKAEIYLDNIRNLLPSLKDRNSHLYYQKVRGIIDIETANYSDGIEHLQKALEIAQDTQNSQLIFNETINVGLVFYSLKRYDKALEFFLDAKKIAVKNDLDQEILLTNLISVYNDLGEVNNALEIADTLIEVAKKTDNLIRKTTYYSNLGATYTIAKEFLKAMETYSKALKIAEEAGLDNRIYYLKFQLATTIRMSGNPEKALPLLKDALVEAKDFKKEYDEEKILREMALCSEMIKDYKSTCNYLKEAEKINKKINDEQTRDKIAQVQAQLEMNQRLNEKDQLMLIYSRQAEMGQMISAIAHQWRQPLNALSVILDSILDDWEFDELDEKTLEKKIESSKELIYSMNNTISDFRSFFKEESQFHNFDISDVIKKAIRFTDYRFKVHNIDFKFSGLRSCIMTGSSNQLLQVLLIILNNAFDAITGRKVKEPVIELSQKICDDACVIKISDNAGGIPKGIIEEIFDLHFTTKSDESNSGIGLYLSKIIVEIKFSGSITVKNTSQGAEFTINIPILK